MLTRILETEFMDSWQEAVDYDSMDHAEVNQRFVSDFLAIEPAPTDLLDLGTGTAQIPVELCRRVPDCRVMAADAAQNMLEIAHYNVEAGGMTSRIQLCQCDAKKLPFDRDMFAAVLSNSIIHHIPEPAVVIAESVRVCAPGGTLFFRDLLRPSDEVTWQQLVEQYAGSCTEPQRKMFADSLRAALTLDEVQQLVAEFGFSRDTVQQTSDRHWTWTARKG